MSLLDHVNPAARARIVTALAEGLSDDTTAVELGIKISTLRNYIGTLCRDYHVPSRDALIGIAYWHGWLDDAEDVPLPLLPTHLHRVLRLMAAGMTVHQIATRTGCGRTTARIRRQEVCAYYGARTRAHALALAYRSRHLLTPRTYLSLPIPPASTA